MQGEEPVADIFRFIAESITKIYMGRGHWNRTDGAIHHLRDIYIEAYAKKSMKYKSWLLLTRKIISKNLYRTSYFESVDELL